MARKGGFPVLGATFALLLLAWTTSRASPPTGDLPETVMVTYQVRHGQEAALRKVLARHWAAARKRNLVHASPHLILQSTEGGAPYVVEIFTWRDGSAPDNAPEEITELWTEMQRLVESRNGRPGIDFQHMEIF